MILALADNIPNETYPYIIRIYTGIRYGSGTKAKVSIQLHGKNSSSRVRKLFSKSKKHTFQNGAEDWFIIKTPKPLGNIRAITIEHDDKGRNPDWFLSQVRVFDPRKRKYWLFLVDEWLTSNPRKGCISAVPKKELRKFAVIFRQKAVMELRDRHIWLSVFCCPHRSSFTRPQRLTCAFVIVTLAMLSNVILFRMIPDDGEAEKPEQILDVFGFKFNFYPIAIGVFSSLIAYAIGFVLIRTFSVLKGRHEKEGLPTKLLSTGNLWDLNADSLGSLASSEMSGEIRNVKDADNVSSKDDTSEHEDDEDDALAIFHKNVFTETDDAILSENTMGGMAFDVQPRRTNTFIRDAGGGDSNQLFAEDLSYHGDPLYPYPLLMRTAISTDQQVKDIVLTEDEVELDIVGVTKRRKFGVSFAWYFVYTSWILIIAIGAASTYFIINIGSVYHLRKSLIWLQCNLLSFLFGVVLLDPLQVIIAILIMCCLHDPANI